MCQQAFRRYSEIDRQIENVIPRSESNFFHNGLFFVRKSKDWVIFNSMQSRDDTSEGSRRNKEQKIKCQSMFKKTKSVLLFFTPCESNLSCA